MKIGFLYTSIGTLAAAYGLQEWTARWLLCWFGFAYLMVGAAYLVRNSQILGKQPNGKLSFYAQMALFPYLSITWAIWYAMRIFRKEPPYHQVLPDLFVGRRLLSKEYPDKFDAVLDLTSEFSEPKAVLARHDYYSLPILDGCGISELTLVTQLKEIFEEDRVLFIHCAEGHGRTGMVAAAAMLLKGIADQPEAAIRFVQNRRPKVRLNQEQKRTVIAAWNFIQALSI
jgi:protein-tyrosine phosphatase